MNKPDNAEKVELLKFFYEKTRDEVDFLRERQDRIFSWSSSVFIALIGALLIFDPSASHAWQSTIWSKLISSVAVITFIGFSLAWQQRTRRWQSENGQAGLRIEQLLHCYDKDYFDPNKETAIFPSRWNSPEVEEPPKLIKRIFAANYASATLLLGALTVIMIWVSGF